MITLHGIGGADQLADLSGGTLKRSRDSLGCNAKRDGSATLASPHILQNEQIDFGLMKRKMYSEQQIVKILKEAEFGICLNFLDD